jgi:hypothetical protein
LIERTIGLDYAQAAAQLRSEITEEDRARWKPAEIGAESISAWANESFAITRRADVGYCVLNQGACWYAAGRPEYRGSEQSVVAVDEGYLAVQGPVVRERLKAAAVRLAAILNGVLTPGL